MALFCWSDKFMYITALCFIIKTRAFQVALKSQCRRIYVFNILHQNDPSAALLNGVLVLDE